MSSLRCRSLDHQLLAGDAEVYEPFAGTGLPKMLERDGSRPLSQGLVQVESCTRERHKKYGNTLFPTWSRALRIVQADCGMCTCVRG